MPPPTTQRTAAVVLLVQPPDDSRDMYAEFLRHHGMDVVCPGDVEEALTLAPAADVVVTGLQLPGAMDGFAFIQHLRADPATRHKPVIVVTSWAWQTERLRAKDAGCDVFLTKPCLPAVLLRHVRRRLTTAARRPISKRPRRSM
jgi:two-component system cell cycle response regulator DivK